MQMKPIMSIFWNRMQDRRDLKIKEWGGRMLASKLVYSYRTFVSRKSKSVQERIVDRMRQTFNFDIMLLHDNHKQKAGEILHEFLKD